MDPSVADLLQRLNLTAEEGGIAEFSDDEDDGEPAATTEWALIGKALSPAALHVSTIIGAMRPAWGNPYGLKIRSIGEKGDNLFVAHFGCKHDMEKALAGSPWVVGKHAVIMKEYDEKVRPSDIRFDRMDIWVRILDLPLGWMNVHRGARAMGLLGDVVKMDVDGDGKASGPFLRARVAIEVAKPIRRGVLLKTDRKTPPEWFRAQYEKLPFFCRSCGLMGHTDLECSTPAPKDENGKLPYDTKLRAPDERKKKMQSFANAAAESFGSASSSDSRSVRGSAGQNNQAAAKTGEEEGRELEEEVVSPLKTQDQEGRKKAPEATAKGASGSGANRQLFEAKKNDMRKTVRKRKPKGSGAMPSPPQGLNSPVVDTSAIVPAGLVSARVNQLDAVFEGQEPVSDELLKKQKMSDNSQTARSAAAASVSPRRAQ
jgi:hypothetical protein